LQDPSLFLLAGFGIGTAFQTHARYSLAPPVETGDCHVRKSALLAMTLLGTLQNCRGKCSKVRKNVTRNLSAFVV